MCYILRSSVKEKYYVGYTINFERRIRQHNGEIAGGAKKTTKFRPWVPIRIISGFTDMNMALRFEYRLQHMKGNLFVNLDKLIEAGDGSISKNTKKPWPRLIIMSFD